MWAAINRHVNKVPDSTWVRSGRLLRGGDFETGPLKTRRSSSGRDARNRGLELSRGPPVRAGQSSLVAAMSVGLPLPLSSTVKLGFPDHSKARRVFGQGACSRK